MNEITTRENIYKHIRNALIDKVENPFIGMDTESPVYHPMKETDDVTFAQEFTRVAGKFVYCENDEDLAQKLKYIIMENKLQNVFCFEEKLKPLLEEFEIPFNAKPDMVLEVATGISFCECLVSRMGSVVVSSVQFSGRRLHALPEIHIIVAYTSQLVTDLKDAFALLKVKYQNTLPSSITVITGPSRTADIEKTLVMGAHGPKELYVFLVEAN
ncbi:MAG: LUD domain-containing protein [Bacteroidales bacterium]|nr:LUD domain-containing protein [Bacteroidales bacterium]